MAGVSADRYRLYLSPMDRKRFDSLSEYYGCRSKASLARILCERCMVRCPSAEDLTHKFRDKVYAAVELLEPVGAANGKMIPVELGALYRGYLHEMSDALNLPSTAVFVRAIILMVSRRDI